MNVNSDHILDTFCEWVSDWCLDNSVPYEDQIVTNFLSGLSNENFMNRYHECCEYLQHG